MLKNYLKSAIRFLKRNRVYTIINALGLSISLAISFIILLFVINEYSYNHCHKNRKQVYRVVSFHKDIKTTMAGTPYVMANTMKEEFPIVEKAINTARLRSFKIRQSEQYINIWYAIATESEVFDIFTIPFVGSQLYDEPLKDLNSIVLSRKLADLFFPGEDPVGKELEVLINNLEQVFTVSGVFQDLPRNSTFRADCMVNGQWELDYMNENFKVADMNVNWSYEFWRTYILLSEKGDAASLESQFEEFENKHISDDPNVHYSLQNLSDVYLKSANIANSSPIGNLKNIRLFSSIALLIVLIATINYIILSIAVSTGRAKEIGIRKTAGASIRRIQTQILTESILLTLFVLPLAVLFMYLGKPYAENLFEKSLDIIPGNIPNYILSYLLLILFIGLASGLYASSYLSRLKVLDVLKQKVSFGSKRKLFRSALIIVQLVIFCSFVAGTLMIRSQYQFALNRDPGYYNKDILQVKLGRGFQSYEALLQGIQSVPEVIDAAGTYQGLPMRSLMVSTYPHFRDEEVKVKVEGFVVGYRLLETLGITLLEGRAFSPDYGSDLTNSVILNEMAVRKLGINDPVGQKMDSSSNIIGVVKDFNLHSIHTEIPPLKITLTEKYLYTLLVHYKAGTLEELIPKLKSEWEKVEPDRPFQYSTIEEVFRYTYAAEKNLSTILSVAAVFALLIAAFGLFGLTLFVARSRTNEIGIRKVFGSSEWAIVYSFLKSNFLLVVVAELLSIPVCIYFLRNWLNNFPYRTGIGWWIFVIAFVIATVVVLATVYIHSRRASRINPVDALRYE